MIKVLAVLVNHGRSQFGYLCRVIDSLRSFERYEVTIMVNSNVSLPELDSIVEKVNIVHMLDPQMLPMRCRSTIWLNRDNFDLFLYGENDHFFEEHHLDNHLRYTSVLPEDRISGLIQYEEDLKGKWFPAYHARYRWAPGIVETYGGLRFAHFTNLHQATFILTKNQLYKICKSHDFRNFIGPHPPKNPQYTNNRQYSLKCRTNTDIYQHCGMCKMICIDEFEQNIIHHLPDSYIGGLGCNEKKMMAAIKEIV